MLAQRGGDSPAAADQAGQQIHEEWRYLISGILGERCHNQFRTISTVTKEFKTTNSTSSAKQEEECIPVPAMTAPKTTHQSAHRGGKGKTGLDSSPSSSLQSRFSTHRLPLLAPWRIHPEVAVLSTMTSWNTACVKSSNASANTFTQPANSVSHKGGNVLIIKQILGKKITSTS